MATLCIAARSRCRMRVRRSTQHIGAEHSIVPLRSGTLCVCVLHGECRRSPNTQEVTQRAIKQTVEARHNWKEQCRANDTKPNAVWGATIRRSSQWAWAQWQCYWAWRVNLH